MQESTRRWSSAGSSRRRTRSPSGPPASPPCTRPRISSWRGSWTTSPHKRSTSADRKSVPDALRDAESGLLNEAYLRAALPNRVATARRALRPLSLGLLVIDEEAATPLTHALLDTLRES